MFYQRIGLQDMSINFIERSFKDIILESVYGKVSFDIYMKVYKAKNIRSLPDLYYVLDDEEYDQVEECVREFFSLVALGLYVKYLFILGESPSENDEDTDWDFMG